MGGDRPGPGGYPVSEEYFARYIANVCQGGGGEGGASGFPQIHGIFRVVLGLTAVGYDVTDGGL